MTSRIVLALLLSWAPIASAVCLTECRLGEVVTANAAPAASHGHDCGGRSEAPAPAHDDGGCACAATAAARLGAKVVVSDAAAAPLMVPVAVAPAMPDARVAVAVARVQTTGLPGRGDLTLRLRNLPLLI